MMLFCNGSLVCLCSDIQFVLHYFFSTAKTVRGVILRYKRALQAFNQGGSMKRAFQKVGVDRNTISRTSPIAELALAAPGVFQALPPWNSQVEKLSTFVDRCREATNDEIKEKNHTDESMWRTVTYDSLRCSSAVKMLFSSEEICSF